MKPRGLPSASKVVTTVTPVMRLRSVRRSTAGSTGGGEDGVLSVPAIMAASLNGTGRAIFLRFIGERWLRLL
ncbi:hypothetical protein FRZ61_45450 [Hypericibacter adhaerens]|uniref:Uncharacterized protein n=1 Tax=Hypericibacter adhaerens TaxID=2602016 RepID=A0A5J6N5D1_9PROT|nr:hypothetical protein FRZ61_45450 [Hypericibacter adhaerens]